MVLVLSYSEFGSIVIVVFFSVSVLFSFRCALGLVSHTFSLSLSLFLAVCVYFVIKYDSLCIMSMYYRTPTHTSRIEVYQRSF